MIPRTAITLGVLAGGRGQRLGGRDKAWVLHHGKTLLQHTLSAFPGGYVERLVSAREPDPRFAKLGLRPVFDQRADFAGPLAALEALCAACTTPWLLTVPVDVQRIPDDLPDALRGAVARDGVVVKDATGLQPLIGLWRTAALGDAVRALLDRLQEPEVAGCPVDGLARFEAHRARQNGIAQHPETLDAFHEAYREVRKRRAAASRGDDGDWLDPAFEWDKTAA